MTARNTHRPDLTVAAGMVRSFVDFAAARGAHKPTLLARAGIAAKDLDDGDARIPFPRYVALSRAAQALTGDPALALHFGAANDMAQVSVVGLIAHAAETMLDALVQMNRYGRLVVEYDGGPERFTVAFRDGGTWMIDNRENPNDFPELTESTFARAICTPHRLGVPRYAQAVHVTHKPPAHAADYARVFQAPVTFESHWNAIRMDPAVMSHRLALEPRYVFGALSARADALLKSLAKAKTFRGRVEGLLLPILHTGDASAESIAAKLALSRQTLFRKLKAEGTSFEKVLDELRHRLALDYLGTRNVSVNETAYLTGFSEPAAFSRAFKRWEGKSPRELRGR